MKKKMDIWYNSLGVGKWKERYYRMLQRKYQFQPWHITPINYRPYAIGIVKYLNNQSKKRVVEIGCGLGEIIGNVEGCEREGYDIDGKVIRAARNLYRNTCFRVGTFENVKDQKIDYLITVNFIHNIAPAKLKRKFEYLCRNNDIRHWILDIVDSPDYCFKHDIDYLTDAEGCGYRIQKRLHRYPVLNGSRWIYILVKKQDKE